MTETHELTFRLLHVAKYAKGHYKKTGDIFADLKLCLQADDYTPFTKEDVLCILSNHIPNVIFRGRDAGWAIKEVRDSCHPKLCWKRGYSHAGDYRSERVKKRDGELRNQPYDFDKALMHFYMIELRMTEMKTLGLSELPEQCIPELYKESVEYCEIFTAAQHNADIHICTIAYNEYGILVPFTEKEMQLPDYEPLHIHLCAGTSKQGDLAYSKSQEIVGINGDSFDSSNKKCIATTDLSLTLPLKVFSIPQAFVDAYIKLNGKIENIDILLDKAGNPVTVSENGIDVIVIGTDCWDDIQEKLKQIEETVTT